jgi:hypothetical protein
MVETGTENQEVNMMDWHGEFQCPSCTRDRATLYADSYLFSTIFASL